MSSPLFERPVYGEELEYGNMVQFLPNTPQWTHPELGKGIRPLEVGETGHIIRKFWPATSQHLVGYQDGGVWLDNGGRAYEDVQHPEYATQETASLDELVASSIAGEELIFEAFRNAVQDKDRALKMAMLTRRAGDHFGNTWGYHENYLAERKHMDINRNDLGMLALHLASRTIFAGGGAILYRADGQGADYMLAQKMPDVRQDFSLHTTGDVKPVMNMRDESHAGDRFARIHVTSGDPLISPAATKLQRGTTQLVLLATQLGYRDPALRFPEDSLHRAAVEIAGDLTLRQPAIELEGGKARSAWHIQVALFSLVQDMLEREDPTGELTEYAAVMKDWEHALTTIEAGEEDDRSLALCGWKHRLRWLEREMGWERDGASRDDLAQPAVLFRQIKYDRIGPKSVSETLRATEWAEDMPSRKTIDYLKHNGSPHTRSNARSAFVKKFVQERDARASWGRLVLPDMHTQFLKDPRDPYNNLVDELSDRFAKRQAHRRIA